MLISIIIPYYKEEENTLKKCLKNLEEQTYKNFEIELICNSSIELSPFFTNDYNVFINIYKSKEYNSIEKLKLIGLEKSRGKYVTFLDIHDEFQEKCFLALLLEPFVKDLNTEISYSNYINNKQRINVDDYGKMYSKNFLNKSIPLFLKSSNNISNFFMVEQLFSQKNILSENSHYIYEKKDKNIDLNQNIKYIEDTIECYNIVKEKRIHNSKKSINFFYQNWIYLFFLLNEYLYKKSEEECKVLIKQIKRYHIEVLKKYKNKISNSQFQNIYLNFFRTNLKTLYDIPIQIGLNEFYEIIEKGKEYRNNILLKYSEKEVK